MKRPGKSAKLPDDRSRAEYAYDHLMTQLRTGELRPGQRLQEVKLAQALDISRTPVRDALRRMASERSRRDGGRPRPDRCRIRSAAGSRVVLSACIARRRSGETGGAVCVGRRHRPDGRTAQPENRREGAARPDDGFRSTSFALCDLTMTPSRNRYMAQALEQMWGAITLLPGFDTDRPGPVPKRHMKNIWQFSPRSNKKRREGRIPGAAPHRHGARRAHPHDVDAAAQTEMSSGVIQAIDGPYAPLARRASL